LITAHGILMHVFFRHSSFVSVVSGTTFDAIANWRAGTMRSRDEQPVFLALTSRHNTRRVFGVDARRHGSLVSAVGWVLYPPLSFVKAAMSMISQSSLLHVSGASSHPWRH